MIFCDWLSIYQDHFGIAMPPQINDGGMIKVDRDGNIEHITKRKLKFEGSHETSIMIKVEGNRVTLEGNIGRMNRPDNLFGYSVLECISKANDLLKTLNIPPFTTGIYSPDMKLYTGAKITRIDLTCNYSLGSEKSGRHFLSYLATQDSRRASVKAYGLSGVTWNEGSKYWYMKAYFKADSLGDIASDMVKEYALKHGIVRHEITLKSRYLTQKKLNKIDSWKNEDMTTNVIYGEFSDFLNRSTCIETPLENIPKRLGHIAIAWRSGKDIYNDSDYSIRTRQRWRSGLLKYGIDIRQPANIVSLNTRVKVLEAEKLSVPDWYWNEQTKAA